MRVALAIAVWFGAAGCYNYVPLETPAPQPDTPIAVVLTDAGSQELTRYLGPNVAVVRGRLLSHDEAALAVSVTSAETRYGDLFTWRGETVTLPARLVASVRERRLAKGRSLLLAGASLAALTATSAAFGLIGGGSGPGRGGGPAPK